MADAEPAENPTTRCTGRDGYVSAHARRDGAGSAAAPAVSWSNRRGGMSMAFQLFVCRRRYRVCKTLPSDPSRTSRASEWRVSADEVVRSNGAQSVIEPPPSTYQAVPTT